MFLSYQELHHQNQLICNRNMQIHYFQKHLVKPFLRHKLQMQTLNLTEVSFFHIL